MYHSRHRRRMGNRQCLFDCTQSMYTASYLPTYPEKSPEDSRISCCWVSGMWYYSGEYTKKTNSFEI